MQPDTTAIAVRRDGVRTARTMLLLLAAMSTTVGGAIALNGEDTTRRPAAHPGHQPGMTH